MTERTTMKAANMTESSPNYVLTPHPCADLFPPMDDNSFDELFADIQKYGLREPIIVDQQNCIVDGLHRYRACIKAGLPFKIERRSLSDDEARNLSISRNLHRRHLDPSQRAAIAADLASLKQGGSQPANLPEAMSQAKAAKLMGISERAVRSAVKVKERSPDLHTRVKAGKLSVHLAEQACNLPEHDRTEVVAKIKKGDIRGAKANVRAVRAKVHPNKVARLLSSGIPAVYAALFDALDALPVRLKDHPLSPEHAAELTTQLRRAIECIEHNTAVHLNCDANEEDAS